MSSLVGRLSPASLRGSHLDGRTRRIQLRSVGWIPVLAALGLSLIGLEAIGTTEGALASRQGVFLLVGIAVAAAVGLPNYRWAERAAWPLVAVAIGLLLFVLVPGVPDFLVHPRHGARRWINLGFTQLQPSEVAKFAAILGVAAWLRRSEHHRTLLGLLVPFALMLGPALLVLIEPDLGTALLFAPTVVVMLLAAGARVRHIAAICLAALLAVPAAYPILRPHQRDRVDALIAQLKGDDRFVRSIGFQADRAITLAGAGGLTGQGVEQAGLLLRENALPEEHNDMVFAVVACRWGMLGGAAVWLLSLAFSLGGFLVAATCRDPFGRLVATGISAIFFVQMAVNTGMTIGMLPITGITLPFVSYGGTSLVACWAMAGLLFAIGTQRRRMFERDSFEFGGT